MEPKLYRLELPKPLALPKPAPPPTPRVEETVLTRTWLIPGTAAERELKLMAAARMSSVSPTLQKLREAVLETREVSEFSRLLVLLSVRKAGLGPRAKEGSFYCLGELGVPGCFPTLRQPAEFEQRKREGPEKGQDTPGAVSLHSDLALFCSSLCLCHMCSQGT